MQPTLAHALNPLERFREIYLLLGANPIGTVDHGWLRFAAQSAVLRPAAPADTAAAIRKISEQLQKQSHWYEALASPVRLVVAATLIQTGDTPEAFHDEVEKAHHVFRTAGFHLSGWNLIKSILAMRVLSEGQSINLPEVERMHQIFLQMKAHHWWLTGSEDVVACALLSTCDGTPEEISGIAEGIYRRLHEADLAAGNHLQTAANILPLSGLSAKAAADRFLSLTGIIQARSMPLWREEFDAIALLSLLDHEPDRIVTRLQEATTMLDNLAPIQFATVNFNVAADLVFLDLVRYDSHLRSLNTPEERERVQDRIRLQRATSLILVQVPPPVVVMGEAGWPLSGLP